MHVPVDQVKHAPVVLDLRKSHGTQLGVSCWNWSDTLGSTVHGYLGLLRVSRVYEVCLRRRSCTRLVLSRAAVARVRLRICHFGVAFAIRNDRWLHWHLGGNRCAASRLDFIEIKSFDATSDSTRVIVSSGIIMNVGATGDFAILRLPV